MRREEDAKSLVADLAAAMAARGQTIQTHTTNEVMAVSPQILEVIRRMAAKIESMDAEHRAEVNRIRAECSKFDTRWQILRRAWSRHSQLFAGPSS